MSYYVNWDTIRVAMKKKKLSDEDLANALGVKRSTIVAWRHRKTGPVVDGPALLDRLCKFLDIDKDQLTNRDVFSARKEVYEELVTNMLHIIKYDNFMENYNMVFRGVLSTEDYKKLRDAIQVVRSISSKAYINLENDRADLRAK